MLRAKRVPRYTASMSTKADLRSLSREEQDRGADAADKSLPARAPLSSGNGRRHTDNHLRECLAGTPQNALVDQELYMSLGCLRLRAPLWAFDGRKKLQAWVNFFSSEMHNGAFGPIFHKGVSEESEEAFRDRLRTRYTHLDRHLADHEYLMPPFSFPSRTGSGPATSACSMRALCRRLA
jgi:hypothetical protein